MFSIKNDIIAAIIFIISTITFIYMNHLTTHQGQGFPWWVALAGLLSILFWLLSILYMAFSLIFGKE